MDDPWEEIEFGCNDCDHFFIARLHKKFHQQCLVECPNCGRRHPRSITEAGEVTGKPLERLYRDGTGKRMSRAGSKGDGDVVLGLECTVSKESRFDKKNFAKDKNDKGGFLSRLWARKYVSEKQ